MKSKVISSYLTFPSIAGSTMNKTMKSHWMCHQIYQKIIVIISNASKTFYPKSLNNIIKKRPLSPESESLSYVETDDTLFGLSEVKISFKHKQLKNK